MEMCGICYETPTVYGLLHCCKHTFCVDCIQQWHGKQIMSSVSQEEAIILNKQNAMFIELNDRFGLHEKTSFAKTSLESLAVIANPARRNVVCPFYQQKSDFIYPAIAVPETPEEKAELRQLFFDISKTVPCKWYALSRQVGFDPFCPYGDDCIEAHDYEENDDDSDVTDMLLDIGLDEEERKLAWERLLAKFNDLLEEGKSLAMKILQ